MGQKYEIIVKLDGLSSTKEEENKEKLKSANGNKYKDPEEEKEKKLAKMQKAAKLMVAQKVKEVAVILSFIGNGIVSLNSSFLEPNPSSNAKKM